jgi:hypothetical protein
VKNTVPGTGEIVYLYTVSCIITSLLAKEVVVGDVILLETTVREHSCKKYCTWYEVLYLVLRYVPYTGVIVLL